LLEVSGGLLYGLIVDNLVLVARMVSIAWFNIVNKRTRRNRRGAEMLLPRFEFHAPVSLGAACKILAELGSEAKILAGGTDLLVNMKKGLARPAHVVSLDRVRGLRGMRSRKGNLSLGGMIRVAELGACGALPVWAEGLAEAARCLGTPLVRNRATVAGNLVTARPAADLAPPLMALGARLLLRSTVEEREVAVDDFFRGPGQCAVRSDEILAEVRVNGPQHRTGSAYVKLGLRRTLEIALVNVASAISLVGKEGPIATARVALGAVAPAPIRSPSAEAMLVGRMPSEPLFAEAAKAAMGDAKPIDDYRGSAEYRRWMVEVLVRRTLNLAWQRALAA
jgi:CO/xanthine dehydrogenase FAD-binding subunit